MHKLILGVIILVVLLLLWKKYHSESMTKIYRGVGYLNTGDEIPVAAGVVNSGIIADYSHTYDIGDGTRESCDLCPNSTICPHCPQFISDKHKWSSAGVVEQLVDNRRCNLAQKQNYTGIDCSQYGPLPYGCKYSNNDLKAECQSAVRPPRLRSGPPLGMFNKSGGFYDFLPPDTDCRTYKTRADEILYRDIMNLDIMSEPASDECEYFGINGYVYKEPCDLKEIIDEQARIMCKRSSTNRN